MGARVLIKYTTMHQHRSTGALKQLLDKVWCIEVNKLLLWIESNSTDKVHHNASNIDALIFESRYKSTDYTHQNESTLMPWCLETSTRVLIMYTRMHPTSMHWCLKASARVLKAIVKEAKGDRDPEIPSLRRNRSQLSRSAFCSASFDIHSTIWR